jgi:type IV secretory pathway VirB10-like protein
MRSLLDALSPLIGAEEEKGSAVTEGWAPSIPPPPPPPSDASNATREASLEQRKYAEESQKEQVDKWKKASMESMEKDLTDLVQEEMSVEYGRLMSKVRFLFPY